MAYFLFITLEYERGTRIITSTRGMIAIAFLERAHAPFGKLCSFRSFRAPLKFEQTFSTLIIEKWSINRFRSSAVHLDRYIYLRLCRGI